jgi:hypothetical protein
MSEQELEKHYLTEHGMVVYKHKTNKELFIQRSFHWKDSCSLIHEHYRKDSTCETGGYEARQHIDSYRFSTYDFGAWELMTKEEFDSVKGSYKEIYN